MRAWPLVILLSLAVGSHVLAEETPLSEAQRNALTDNYDQPPRIKKQTKPYYPLSAFQRKLQGTVEIEFVVDEKGQVREAYEIKPKEPPRPGLEDAANDLSESALNCVREWRFEPATKDGRPVATLARAPVSFRIDDDKRKKTPTSPP